VVLQVAMHCIISGWSSSVYVASDSLSRCVGKRVAALLRVCRVYNVHGVSIKGPILSFVTLT